LHDKINLIIAPDTKKKKNLMNVFYDLSMIPADRHTFGGKKIRHEKDQTFTTRGHLGRLIHFRFMQVRDTSGDWIRVRRFRNITNKPTPDA